MARDEKTKELDDNLVFFFNTRKKGLVQLMDV